MATKRNRGSSWEFIVKRKTLLPKPLYLTFSSEAEGDKYVAKLEALLDNGIVPEEFRVRAGDIITVEDAARRYLTAQYVPESDKAYLAVVVSRVGATPLRTIDYAWVEAWIRGLKREQKLSPTTIRHHVGALARCFDWGSRHGIATLAINPLRLLPKGYASYSAGDVQITNGQRSALREDVERDRRLNADEEARIRDVLSGSQSAEGQRGLALREQAALECLFVLALETAMRLRELYTLTAEQIDLARKTIFLDKTKNGDKRQVPLSRPAIAAIKAYQRRAVRPRSRAGSPMPATDTFFPWWNGRHDAAVLRGTTAKLSQQFARIFASAQCADLRFHDLRHEATSRLFERTDLSDIEVSRITGHKDPRVLRRYSNLRGSDLARKLW